MNEIYDIPSVKTCKFIHIGKKKIPIGDVRLDVVFRTYLSIMKEKITEEKVKDFIDNF